MILRPRLSGFFDYPDFFGHEYLLVTIKIGSHVLFKTTALKSAVKCEGFLLSKGKSSACACRVANEEHSIEFWMAQSCFVASEISRSMACSAFIHDPFFP